MTMTSDAFAPWRYDLVQVRGRWRLKSVGPKGQYTLSEATAERNRRNQGLPINGVGRPPKNGKEAMILFPTRLTHQQLDWLTAEAERRGSTVNEIIRELINGAIV